MTTQFLKNTKGHQLAFSRVNANESGPGLMWLSGFNSDMHGTKVLALKEHARIRKQPFVTFDYSGHGQSEGRFEEGNISQWLDDSITVFDKLTNGPQILVGSSMGGWLALLLARLRKERIVGLVLIAPAPDFTENLMWQNFEDKVKVEILENSVYYQPSEYGEPYPITRQLIEDGRKWLMMDKKFEFSGKVRILQGMRDKDVPWKYAYRLLDVICSDDVIASLNKRGDHRLSSESDIQRLLKTCDEISDLK